MRKNQSNMMSISAEAIRQREKEITRHVAEQSSKQYRLSVQCLMDSNTLTFSIGMIFTAAMVARHADDLLPAIDGKDSVLLAQLNTFCNSAYKIGLSSNDLKPAIEQTRRVIEAVKLATLEGDGGERLREIVGTGGPAWVQATVTRLNEMIAGTGRPKGMSADTFFIAEMVLALQSQYGGSQHDNTLRLIDSLRKKGCDCGEVEREALRTLEHYSDERARRQYVKVTVKNYKRQVGSTTLLTPPVKV